MGNLNCCTFAHQPSRQRAHQFEGKCAFCPNGDSCHYTGFDYNYLCNHYPELQYELRTSFRIHKSLTSRFVCQKHLNEKLNNRSNSNSNSNHQIMPSDYAQRTEAVDAIENTSRMDVSNKSTFGELPHATGKVQLSQTFDQSPVSNSYLACSRNPGVCGLQNIGNTCFMNSAVQCLSNVEPLTKYFINEAYQNDINRSNALGTQGEVARAYAHLITRMWTQEQERIEPVQLKRQIARYAPQFDNFRQQDSQEFMNFLIDALHEDLKNNKDSSVVSKLFRGTVEITVQCAHSDCAHAEITENYFTFLSLPIQSRTDGSMTIGSCLRALLADETLGKSGQWLCHSCGKKSDAFKTTLIRLLPPILILHLKRFNFDRTYEKIDVKVTYPTEGLDLSQYVSIEKHKAQYDLIAVSNHRGFLKGGHYATVAKNFKNKQWYKFDDDYITPVTHQVDIVSKDAYVLVYQRKGI